MNDTEKRKLQSILRKLDSLTEEIAELLGDETKSEPRRIGPSENAARILGSINALSSNELESELNTLGQKDLGEVFVAVGGSSGDKRKPKTWLVERILWLSKEFAEGHKSIRDS